VYPSIRGNVFILFGTQDKRFPADLGLAVERIPDGGKYGESGDFQRYKIGISLHKYKLGLNLK
jgi:hypothetical protein